jgi:hypothetical protein
MQLSPHFSLDELTRTSHADVDNTPDQETMVRLVVLAAQFLEPMRAKFGPLIIDSGYRSAALNAKVGGAKLSAHLYGCAADVVSPTYSPDVLVRWVVEESGLPFDQVIDEHVGAARWCHIGIVRPGFDTPRKQAMIFTGSPPYLPFK